MNSQICEPDEGEVQPRDVLAEADREIENLEALRLEIASRRRILTEPTHKVVVAHPTAMHRKITLGGVLVNAGFQAADADALAGLLSISVEIFTEKLTARVGVRPDASAAEIIAELLDLNARELTARGLFLTWRKKMEAYRRDCADWLARDEALRLNGRWRESEMSPDQRWLMRVTCQALKIALPGHLLRGQAADWLEAHGANLNYGDFDDDVPMD